MAPSSNFDFLKEHDPLFLQLATAAERVFSSDPNTTLIKLRQFGEALAQDVAPPAQAELLSKLQRELNVELTADWRAQNPELISGDNSAETLLARIRAARADQPKAKRGRKPAPAG